LNERLYSLRAHFFLSNNLMVKFHTIRRGEIKCQSSTPRLKTRFFFFGTKNPTLTSMKK